MISTLVVRVRASCVVLMALAGCAAQQVPFAAPALIAQETAVAAGNTGLAELAAKQRLAAETAERQGQWADAMWAWDVLLALAPQDAELAKRRGSAQATIEAAVNERLPRARLATQRGDAETAFRLFLEILALVPGQPEAGQALRKLERERVTRQNLGQLSRNALLRKDPDISAVATPAAPGNASAPATSNAGGGAGRNELEHASLLAAQGEHAAAIAVLAAVVTQTPVDPAVKSLLADLYYRQAEAAAGSNRAAAITSLQRSLQLDPAHARAAIRLKQLQATKAP